MSTYSLFVAWCWYIAGCLFLMLAFWRLTRFLPVTVKLVSRALVAALLLSPASVAGGHVELAPAWLVTLFDGIMQDDIGFMRGGKPMLVMSVLALIVAGVAIWLEKRRAARLVEIEEAPEDVFTEGQDATQP